MPRRRWNYVVTIGSSGCGLICGARLYVKSECGVCATRIDSPKRALILAAA